MKWLRIVFVANINNSFIINYIRNLLIVKLVINMRLKIDVGIRLISYGLRSG